MARFEKVSRFKDVDIKMPARKTMYSAGYDFVVAEDVIIPAYEDVFDEFLDADEIEDMDLYDPFSLEEAAKWYKKYHAKPTLVSTGMKCHLDNDQYLQLSVRSSCPLKHWLILANGVGIIDGEIFFQIINLSPVPVYLKRGDRIGQGIIMKYDRTDDDKVNTIRTGGMGSTGA